MAHEPFDDVSVAELLNHLYAERDLTRFDVGREYYDFVIRDIIIRSALLRSRKVKAN